ncbi:metal-dependent hydrolase [Parvibaculum sp. MBR-TMA-1.3b-4.2]|jgi:predicted metal-dependent hydrolase
MDTALNDTPALQSGSKLDFKVRNRQFASGEDHHWYGGDPVITAHYNALSSMFPDGERFFCDSVRAQKDKITDPKLLKEISAFVGQEAVHSREHKAYNERIQAQGYPMDKLEGLTQFGLKIARRRLPLKWQLGQTCALEHFTAMLANQLLRDTEMAEKAKPEDYELWMWHAVEETEHKAVAFDTLKAVSSPVGFYMNRIRAILMTTLFFNIGLVVNMWLLLRADGLQWSPRAWGRWVWYMLGKPGHVRKSIGEYLDWFRPSFHPWDHDNRELVERWKIAQGEKLDAEGAAATAA